MPNSKQIISKFKRAASGRETTLEYNGETVEGLKGGISQDQAWQTQGYQDEYSVSVWIEAGKLGRIESRTRIKMDGEFRRILGVHPDSMGALERVDLGAINAGA